MVASGKGLESMGRERLIFHQWFFVMFDFLNHGNIQLFQFKMGLEKNTVRDF